VVLSYCCEIFETFRARQSICFGRRPNVQAPTDTLPLVQEKTHPHAPTFLLTRKKK
jgi:hypothetical protein